VGRWERTSTLSITPLPSGEGKSFCTGSSAFVTIEKTAKDTAEKFALVELVEPTGSAHQPYFTTPRTKPFAS
jgi:hypothetical protein